MVQRDTRPSWPIDSTSDRLDHLPPDLVYFGALGARFTAGAGRCAESGRATRHPIAYQLGLSVGHGRLSDWRGRGAISYGAADLT